MMEKRTVSEKVAKIGTRNLAVGSIARIVGGLNYFRYNHFDLLTEGYEKQEFDKALATLRDLNRNLRIRYYKPHNHADSK